MDIHKFFFAALLGVAASSQAWPQEPVHPKSTPRIVTATRQVTVFTELEKRFLEAVQKKDEAGLRSMMDDEFNMEFPNADPLPGEDWLRHVMAADFTLKSFLVRQMSAVDLGNAVVVKFNRIQKATWKGQDHSGEFFVIDVWKKEGDSWKISNRYVTKVESVSHASPETKPTGKN